MTNEHDERDNQQNSNDLGSDPDVPIIHTPAPEHPYHPPVEARQRHHYIQRCTEFVSEHWPTASTWNTVGTWITAAATVMMVIVYFQIKGIMNSQGTQTEQIIKAAKLQACAAQKIADASDRNAAAAESFSKSAGGINQHTQAAVRQFEKQFDLAKAELQIEGRAWIQPTFYSGNVTLLVSPSYIEPFGFVNVGATPASKVHVDVVLEFLTTEDTLVFDYSNQRYFMNAGLLFPHSPRELSVAATKLGPDGKVWDAPMSQDFIVKFNAGSAAIFMYGKIAYRDKLGEHWTHFCTFRNITPRFGNTPLGYGYTKETGEKCSGYNTTD